MKFIIFAPCENALAEARSALRNLDNVEFRVGTMPEATQNCDALILPGVFAHDRYGGRADTERAQVLVNKSGDVAPALIVATPSYAPYFKGSHPVPEESKLSDILAKCISAAKNSAEHSISTVAIPIESMGFEGIDKRLVASAFHRSLSSAD
ncbi:hypothetical protein [Nocardia africana]|uniref:hypothetical protein n=1 Tax=Nocardia africana TaxID=134964 RepID=UPI000FE1DDEC|nr:hypothetical protein [Nocardia africana]MCC3316424.1 hypothetical protein [Nocardia africana]